MLDIRKGLEGQVAVFRPELRASQAKLADITMQCNGARGRVNKPTVKHDAADALEATQIGYQRAAAVAREALSRDLTT